MNEKLRARFEEIRLNVIPGNGTINDLMQQAYDMALQDRWISVDDYPKEDGRYLCYYTTRQDKTPHISILSWKNRLGFNGQFIVTKYQPLPTAPKS